MLKSRTSARTSTQQDGRLLVDVQLTLAVKATSLELADLQTEAYLQALDSCDFEELKKLGETVHPASWQPWVASPE